MITLTPRQLGVIGAGSVTVTQSGLNYVISGSATSSTGSASIGVGSLNGFSGDLNLTGVGSVTVIASGQTLTISGSSSVANFSGYITTGNADLRYYNLNNSSGFINSLSGLSTGYVQTAISAPFSSLTDASTVTISCNPDHGSQNRKLSIAASVTRALLISGAVPGMAGILKVTNGGNSNLTLPNGSKVINGGSGMVALTATASAIDVLCWVYDGTDYLWTFGPNFN